MSFEELVERISPKLKAIAKKLNGRFTFFDEDDLYQEALIFLWGKFKEGETHDKTDSFILQGSFFFLKNYIRVACKKVDINSVSLSSIIDNEGNTLENVVMAEDPERQFSFVMVDILVEDILSCLTEREKDVFLLSLEDMTTRQMGEELGISHVMVTKVEKRIREKCADLGLTKG